MNTNRIDEPDAEDLYEFSQNGRISDSALGALVEIVGDPDVGTISPMRRDFILRALNELIERRADEV
jgi:hypothetical protein